MNVAIEKLPECRAKLTAEVPSAKVESMRDHVVSLFMSQAKIPGFRPGKLPRKVVENKFKDGIRDELKERLVREIIQIAYKEHELEILGISEVERENFELDGTFSFHSEVVTKPDVDLTEEDYKNIPVEVYKMEVTDEMVDGYFERVRKNFASHEPDEDGIVDPGDVVELTFTSTWEENPLEDGEDERFNNLMTNEEGIEVPVPEDDQPSYYEIVPGLGAGAVGLKVGETADVEVAFGDEYFIEEFKGSEAVYHITVKSVKKRILPEVTDELAEQVGEESLEKWREMIVGKMEEEIEDYRRKQIEQGVLEHINKEHQIELPQELVFNETQNMVNHMVTEAVQNGMNPDEIDGHEDELVDSAQSRAVSNLTTRYLLEDIAEKEKLSVTDDELSRQIAYMAHKANKPIKKYAIQLRENPGFEAIRGDILISKVIDFLSENASVTEVDPPEEEEQETSSEEE